MTLDANNVFNYIDKTNKDIDNRNSDVSANDSLHLENTWNDDTGHSRLKAQEVNEKISILTAEMSFFESNTNALEFELTDVTDNFNLDIGILSEDTTKAHDSNEEEDIIGVSLPALSNKDEVSSEVQRINTSIEYNNSMFLVIAAELGFAKAESLT